MFKNCSRVNSKSGSNECVHQKNPQPLLNFAKDKKRSDGLTAYCKTCLKTYRDENKEHRNKIIHRWRVKNPEKTLASRNKNASKNVARAQRWRLKNPSYRFLRAYGITKEDYDFIKSSQEHKCLLCKTPQEELSKALHVDHCHKTGKVRGLLCSCCNQALGMFKEDILRMKRAIEYLEEHREG